MPEPTVPPRTVEVPAERLARFVDTFRDRHPDTATTTATGSLELRSPDGAYAILTAPFPPVVLGSDPLPDLVAHVLRDRRLGILLVRRGGFAVGIAEGRTLVAAKVGTAYVQGRTKAGGWSQQRFARRRANQAAALYDTAADEAARLLLPGDDLDALVTGGDQAGVAAVLDDPRLVRLRGVVDERRFDVPDPRRRVLETIPDRARSVRVLVHDPTHS